MTISKSLIVLQFTRIFIHKYTCERRLGGGRDLSAAIGRLPLAAKTAIDALRMMYLLLLLSSIKHLLYRSWSVEAMARRRAASMSKGKLASHFAATSWGVPHIEKTRQVTGVLKSASVCAELTEVYLRNFV